MTLIYAYGSGIGHLKRVSDFIRQREIPPEKCVLITQNPDGYFWEKAWKVIPLAREIFADKDSFKVEFDKIFSEFEVNEIIVDVFPEGFFGELSEVLESFSGRKVLLARILKEDYFEKFKPKTIYDEVYLLENGISPENYLSKKLVAERLPYYFKDDETSAVPDFPFYIVVHSQPSQEVANLVRQAEMHDPKIPILIFTNCELPTEIIGSHGIFFGKQPPRIFLERAKKIFSAAGFNAVRILQDFRDKTEFTPFPRLYDDQFLRKKFLKI